MKKIIPILLALTVMLCGCSPAATDIGGETGSDNPSSAVSNFTLAFCSADTLNPYTAAKQINRSITRLMYDPLVKIDNDLKPIYVLANNIVTEGKTCTVTIKPAQFSDGTSLSASDVVYSFNLAKSGSNEYAGILSEVISATQKDGRTVVFNLSKIDPYAENLLTFPIIKSESDKLTTSDNMSLPPIGSGRYVYDGNLQLVSNKSWIGGNISLETINLINAPDNEALYHYVESGAVDMYSTDLSDCNITRMSSTRSDITLNNLVYLGLNLNNVHLSDANFRHGLSLAVNREKICESSYFTNAVPATGFFNPKWDAVKSMQSIQSVADTENSVVNFEKIWYNYSNGVLNKDNNAVAFNLIVNGENSFRKSAAEQIVTQLSSVGIKVNLSVLSYNDYINALQNGNFDLYLAEVNIPYNMDLSPLLTKSGSLSYGLIKDTVADDDGQTSLETVINNFYNGTGTVSDIAAIAISEMPVIPICYRNGLIFYGNNISGDFSGFYTDVYYGIENFKVIK